MTARRIGTRGGVVGYAVRIGELRGHPGTRARGHRGRRAPRPAPGTRTRGGAG